MKIVLSYNGVSINDTVDSINDLNFDDHYLIMICGSRSINNSDYVEKILKRALLDRKELVEGKEILIVEGGASGVDRNAKQVAEKLNFPWLEIPAEWNNLNVPGALIRNNKYGKPYNAKAGFIRNEVMVKISDLVIILHDGKSKGTLHDYNLCKRLHKDYEYYNFG